MAETNKVFNNIDELRKDVKGSFMFGEFFKFEDNKTYLIEVEIEKGVEKIEVKNFDGIGKSIKYKLPIKILNDTNLNEEQDGFIWLISPKNLKVILNDIELTKKFYVRLEKENKRYSIIPLIEGGKNKKE